MEHNSHSFKVCYNSDFLPKGTVWEGWGLGGWAPLEWRNLTNTAFTRWSRSISTGINPIESLYAWYGVMRRALYLSVFPQTLNSCLIRKKKKKKKHQMNHSWGTLYKKSWPALLNIQGHSVQTKYGKLSQPREAQRNVATTCNVRSWNGRKDIR